MSEKERQQAGKERRRRGVLRELIENSSPEDLKSLLFALGATQVPSEDHIELETAELVESLISEPSNNRTQFGILEFQKRVAESSLGWSMRWLDKGTERTESGIAESHGDDLVLSGFPSNIRALELISGIGIYEDRIQLDCTVDLDSQNEPTIRLADSFLNPSVNACGYILAAAAADDEEESESLWSDDHQLAASSSTSAKGLDSKEIDECTICMESGQLSIHLRTTREVLHHEQFVWLDWCTGQQSGQVPAQLILQKRERQGVREISRFKVVLTRAQSGKALPNNIEDLLAAGAVNQVSLHLRTSREILANPKSSTFNSSNRIYLGFYSDGELRFSNGYRILDELPQTTTANHNYLLRIKRIDDTTSQRIEELVDNIQDNEDFEKLIRWINQIDERRVALEIGSTASAFFDATGGSNKNKKPAEKAKAVNRKALSVASFLKDTLVYPAIYRFPEDFNQKTCMHAPSVIEIAQCAVTTLSRYLKSFFGRFENNNLEQRAKACRELLLVVARVDLYWGNASEGRVLTDEERQKYVSKSISHNLNNDRRKDSAGGDRYVSHLRAIGNLKKIGEEYYTVKFPSTPMDRQSVATLARDLMFSTDQVESFLLVILNAADQLLEDQQRSSDKTAVYSWEEYFLTGLGLHLTQLTRGTPEKENLAVLIRQLFLLPSVHSIHSAKPEERRETEANIKDWSVSDISYEQAEETDRFLIHRREHLDGFVSALQDADTGPQMNAKLFAWLHRFEELPDSCTNNLVREVQRKLSTNSRPSRETLIGEVSTQFGVKVSVDTLRTWERNLERKWSLWQVAMRVQNKHGDVQALLTCKQAQRLKDRILKEGLRSQPEHDDPINCMTAVLALFHDRRIVIKHVDFLEQWLFRKDTDESLMKMDLMQDILNKPSTDSPASLLTRVKISLSSLVFAKLLTSTITGAEVPLTNRQAQSDQEGDREFDVAMDMLMDNPFKTLELKQPLQVHRTIADEISKITNMIPEEFKAFHRDRLLGKPLVRHQSNALQVGNL